LAHQLPASISAIGPGAAAAKLAELSVKRMNVREETRRRFITILLEQQLGVKGTKPSPVTHWMAILKY
jgi:hypothetical protein